MKTLAQLARIKKIRAKKRKILNQYGNQPVKPSFDYDAVSVKELYPSKLKEDVAAETFLDVIL